MSTGDPASAADVVARLRAGSAFALLRRWDADAGAPGPVEVLIGRIETADELADIPLPAGVPDLDHDALALVPFRQIRERGYDCHDDGTPLQVLRVEQCHQLEVGEALETLPNEDIALEEAGFDLDDASYRRSSSALPATRSPPGRARTSSSGATSPVACATATPAPR